MRLFSILYIMFFVLSTKVDIFHCQDRTSSNFKLFYVHIELQRNNGRIATTWKHLIDTALQPRAMIIHNVDNHVAVNHLLYRYARISFLFALGKWLIIKDRN